ncbi:hypothetical protein COLO4_02769 [Corchorus olitorius]|uniref:Uncharacterized protein n=1 Tax=Corchorus olitorius TaxID=93759 RepID=A0A1R3L0C8_9ROSI|nr:hypothetical protein COLO4_02769 [Corchorus olitorius]
MRQMQIHGKIDEKRNKRTLRSKSFEGEKLLKSESPIDED